MMVYPTKKKFYLLGEMVDSGQECESRILLIIFGTFAVA